MTSTTSGNRHRNGRAIATGARAALVALVIAGPLLANREASAAAAVVAAAQSADAGIGACGSNSGKALYGCVANVLEKLSTEVSSAANAPAVQSALQNAASKLRSATSKGQALSAITQCRALVASVLQQVKAEPTASRGGRGGGTGNGPGLQAIIGVLSHAASLIQSKG